ncbi:hypothetical protein [Haematobacter sp.]|uniref:hypothetical protein n=1 Tax=Haematobacter sp. TaxID=2953762 RepID=UPI0028AC9B6C|nr:hypothetical protein [Haematobacter sp.]
MNRVHANAALVAEKAVVAKRLVPLMDALVGERLGRGGFSPRPAEVMVQTAMQSA